MRVAVHVHPRSSRARVAWDGVVLELWVTAPAVEGLANRAVLDAVASWARVRPSLVRLVSGARSRRKVVEIGGVDALPPANRL